MNDRDFEKLMEQVLSETDNDSARGMGGEPPVAKQVAALFKGRWRYLNAMTLVFMLLLFVATVFCAVRFLGAETVPEMIRWGAGGFVCWFGVAYLKLWTWLELERHAVTREIKRLELQVAHLAASLQADKAPASGEAL